MAVIRLQNKVPNVYTWESRDFQLLCRIFDCIANGVKYSIDSILSILDATKCSSSMLQLVQTKLGFFTERDVEDDTLRCILSAFPLMVRAKGSLKAVQEAINVFLKAYSVTTEINVWYVTDSAVVYNTEVSDHTIVIGLNKALSNLYVLEEMFRYLLPTGFGFYLYFYNTIDEVQEFAFNTNAKLLYASDNINSFLRSRFSDTEEYIPDKLSNELLNAVDTMEIASSDSLVSTETGTYEPGDKMSFLGILTSEPLTKDINDKMYVLLKEFSSNSKGYEVYYGDSNKWNKINFIGYTDGEPSEKENGLSWANVYNVLSIDNFESGIKVSIDNNIYQEKAGKVKNIYKYNKKNNNWTDEKGKVVNLQDVGITVVLNEKVLLGGEQITVYEGVNDNSVITDKYICNNYVYLNGRVINTKTIYNLYKEEVE